MTSGDILTQVNKYTGFGDSASDIATELKDRLIDLSHRGPFLERLTTGTIAASSLTITAPTDLAVAQYLKIGDDVWYPITWTEYLEGSPDGFAERSGTIYLTSGYASSQTYYLYYGKEHPDDADTILFESRYRKALVFGVCADRFRQKEQWDKAAAFEQMWEVEIEKVDSMIPAAPPVCQPRSPYRG